MTYPLRPWLGSFPCLVGVACSVGAFVLRQSCTQWHAYSEAGIFHGRHLAQQLRAAADMSRLRFTYVCTLWNTTLVNHDAERVPSLLIVGL